MGSVPARCSRGDWHPSSQDGSSRHLPCFSVRNKGWPQCISPGLSTRFVPHHDDGPPVIASIVEVVSTVEYDGVGEIHCPRSSHSSPWELEYDKVNFSQIKVIDNNRTAGNCLQVWVDQVNAITRLRSPRTPFSWPPGMMTSRFP